MNAVPPPKSHLTAVVLIPPAEAQEPIQQIRRRYYRKIDRWMPHITMLYPFAPRDAFQEASGGLAEACAAVQPFEITLKDFSGFDHGGGRFTLWLGF